MNYYKLMFVLFVVVFDEKKKKVVCKFGYMKIYLEIVVKNWWKKVYFVYF